MTDSEHLKVDLLIWKSIAASRERQRDEADRFFKVACEIAEFWRDHAPNGLDYPDELKGKIADLAP